MENNKQEMEMRLYDLNKTIMVQMPELKSEEVKTSLKKYFDNYENVPAYHMLLSAESRDFTVIEFDSEISEDTISKAISEIEEVLVSRGPIKEVSLNEDGTVDIWINDIFYKLFDYSWGVITV